MGSLWGGAGRGLLPGGAVSGEGHVTQGSSLSLGPRVVTGHLLVGEAPEERTATHAGSSVGLGV
jgi:hypothetical protein